ncbi:MAG: MBL fold metallo-hydrolase [Pseudomonadota bacterium]
MSTINVSSQQLIRETFPVGPLGCNCTILGDPIRKTAVVIDPGGNPELITACLEKHGLKLVEIIHTHAHLDHFLASGILKEQLGVPLILHEEDLFLWRAVRQQCRMFRIPEVDMPDPDSWLIDGYSIAVGDGVALHTPGHTPGSTTFLFEKDRLLITGDTLFLGSIGRTDLPGGDMSKMRTSLKKLCCLDDDLCVVPGHGEETTLENEKQFNPFIQQVI